MGQSGQKPDPSKNGSFLSPRSVVGRKVDFVNVSDVAVATINLAASGDATNFDFGQVIINFDFTVNGISYPWESVIAWNYSQFYVDNIGFSPTYLWRQGSAVSGNTAPLRKPMLIDIIGGHNQNLGFIPSLGSNSHRTVWFLKNNDSSTHYVNVISIWKYILMGGLNG